MKRSIALLANPASGRGKVRRILPEVIDRFEAARIEVETVLSQSATDAIERARTLADRHSVVVAAGGDGMVHLVANGILGTQAALGIIPCGTGNDFATNLGYARSEPMDACRSIIAGNRRRVDVGQIAGGPAFVCVAGAGFDSEVNRLANRIRGLHGTSVYVLATLRTLAKFRPARFAITLDGNQIDRDLMFVAIGNASSYGGGMKITPAAILDDGLLDVTMVGAMGRPSLMVQFPRLFKGTHVEHPAVTTARAKKITIESDQSFYLYADGEEIAPLPVSIEIVPRALEVISP